MRNVELIRSFEQIKLLSDSRRMKILRLLMASPATLTQLAGRLGQSPAWIRHHVKALESADLVELAGVRTTGTVTEKFYRARAGAFVLQELVLPKSRKPVMIFSGSHDLALEAAAASLAKHLSLLSLPVGSLDGLVNLRQGLCHLSGAHLLDENGEYNIPYIRRFFPDRDVNVVTLASRTQGLMFRKGNPKKIKQISDLANPTIRFVNRNAGSGTRLWIDKELKKTGIPPEAVRGYARVVSTHSEAARLVSRGKGDVALGLQAAARQHELGFTPLFDERYDLVLPREQESVLAPLLDYLQTRAFHRTAESLTGYSAAHSGEQIPL
jgi:putative molybdopterin biosynthesis protein